MLGTVVFCFYFFHLVFTYNFQVVFLPKILGIASIFKLKNCTLLMSTCHGKDGSNNTLAPDDCAFFEQTIKRFTEAVHFIIILLLSSSRFYRLQHKYLFVTIRLHKALLRQQKSKRYMQCLHLGAPCNPCLSMVLIRSLLGIILDSWEPRIDLRSFICKLVFFQVLLFLFVFFFQEHHEEDFFLYIAYSDESVYGA